MKNKKISDIFPIFSIGKNGLIVNKNADLSIILKVDYAEVFCLSEANYLSIMDAIGQAAKSLGEGYIIHKQDIFLEKNYVPNLSYNPENDIIIEKNELNFVDRPTLIHKSYFIITLPNSDPIKKDSTEASIFRKFTLNQSYLSKNMADIFYSKIKSFQTTISQSKLIKVQIADYESIIGNADFTGILKNYFSLSYSDKTLSDINTDKGSLNIGGKYCQTRVINSIDQFPNDIYPTADYLNYSTDNTKMVVSNGMSLGLNLQFNHIYNQIFYVLKQKDLKVKLQSEVKRHFSFSAWSSDNTFSMQEKTKFIDTLTATNSLAIVAHFNVMFFHEDPKTLAFYGEQVDSTISNMGFVPKKATTYAEQLYWACIPGNASELGKDNFVTCLMDNAIALMNVETNYKDTPFNKSGILVTDRFGQPRIVDLFYQPLKDGLIYNRNFCVIGPSGSGKSFTMNNIVYYSLVSGAHVTIVDIGHSYKRLGEIAGAKYITHTDENPISLNPFYFKNTNINSDEIESAKGEFKEVIVKILTILYKKQDDSNTKSEEITLITLVNEYYLFLSKNALIKPSFNTFYEFANGEFRAIFDKLGGRAEKEFDLNNFLFIIRPYYRGGEFDFLLNSEKEEDLSELPFVIYELDNIKDHPILLPIVTLVITNNYVTKLFGLKNKLKILIIEEAWKAVSNDFFATFLLWAFKTARKHFGAIGVISQEIDDLLKSNVIGEAIIQNTDIKILMDLRNYENDIQKVVKSFKVSEKDLAQIFSINKRPFERPKFNEMAVILGKTCKVYGVEVSREAYALFTTEPSEVDEIKSIAERKNISQKDAAIEWAERPAP